MCLFVRLPVLALALGLGAASAQTGQPAQPAPQAPQQAAAQPALTDAALNAALSKLFTQDIQADWFAPDFLKNVPIEVIRAQFASIRDQLGEFVRLEPYQDSTLAVLERGTLLITAAQLDAQGRFTILGATNGPSLADLAASAPAATSAETPKPTAPSSPAPSTAHLSAEQTTQQKILEQIFLGTPTPELFAPDFLAAVPFDTLVGQLLPQLRASGGDFVAVEHTPQGFVVRQKQGSLLVKNFVLDAQGRVSGLFVGPLDEARPAVSFSDFAQAKAGFAALGQRVSVLVQPLSGEPLLALNATRPYAVGSTFKLAVLAQLRADIAAGKLTWTQEVTLRDQDKSLPSGTLQDAAAGSRYSLQELALRMIRDSDNTATDLLMNVVSRPEMEQRFGQVPMPNTRQAFVLKTPSNVSLLRAYRAALGQPEVRRAVLEQASQVPLNTAELVAAFAKGKPLAADVEWFASAQHLCALMASVRDLPAVAANPGVARPSDFAQVAYKGGSETGVLNLTTMLTTKAGQSYCVSATWNDARALDEAKMLGMYGALLDLLKER